VAPASVGGVLGSSLFHPTLSARWRYPCVLMGSTGIDVTQHAMIRCGDGGGWKQIDYIYFVWPGLQSIPKKGVD